MNTHTQGAPVSVLVTGAAGYVGKLALAALVEAKQHVPRGRPIGDIVAVDVRSVPEAGRLAGVTYAVQDVRSPALGDLMRRHRVEVVAHLAAIVTPGKSSNRELEYSVDVLGTKNVLEQGLGSGVKKVVVTSSGAAYGYHADNPSWLTESDALRGNREFAYSDHKRQVEEMLALWRTEHPDLEQVVLRPGTVLGEGAKNQITSLFEGRVVVGLRGAETPFVLIWDRDLADIIVQSVVTSVCGVFNVAGDGAVPMRELAAMLEKPFVALPPGLVKGALWLLKRVGRTQYGPEQVDFLRYRPVLANDRLKSELPYQPTKTSREVFQHYVESRRAAARTGDHSTASSR